MARMTVLLAPPKSHLMLPGITYDVVLELAAQAGMKFEVRPVTEAEVRGADELWLSVFVDNHRARRFYERYGFEVIGRYDFIVGSHADEDHVMRLKL